MTADKAQLWALLRRHGLVTADLPPGAEAPTFWFVRLLLAIGGWLGALFLLAFVAQGFSFIIDRPVASFVAGAVVCAAAAALLQARMRNDFLAHFGFAVSLAGQGLMAWGLERGLHAQSGATAFAIAAQQAVLFLLVANIPHRLWTSGTAAIAVAYGMHQLHLGPYASALMTAAVAWIWLKEFDRARRACAWRAAGYGITVAAVAATALAEVPAWISGRGAEILGGRTSVVLGGALGGAVLVFSAFMLLKREGVPATSPAGRSALIVAAILAAAAIKAPGLAPAVAILVLGFANGNRVLAAFGIVALLAYLSHYYYSLHATLLEKSALLAATGVALLVARVALGRDRQQRQSEAHDA